MVTSLPSRFDAADGQQLSRSTNPQRHTPSNRFCSYVAYLAQMLKQTSKNYAQPRQQNICQMFQQAGFRCIVNHEHLNFSWNIVVLTVTLQVFI